MCTGFYFAHKLSSKHELSGGARWVLFYRNWAKKTSSGGRGEGSQVKVKNEVNADTHVREVVCGRGALINAAPHREERDYGGTGTARSAGLSSGSPGGGQSRTLNPEGSKARGL